MPAAVHAGNLLGRIAVMVALGLLTATTASAASWDELTPEQRELFRQAVEEGGTATPTQPVAAAGQQMYLDLREDPDPTVRRYRPYVRGRHPQDVWVRAMARRPRSDRPRDVSSEKSAAR